MVTTTYENQLSPGRFRLCFNAVTHLVILKQQLNVISGIGICIWLLYAVTWLHIVMNNFKIKFMRMWSKSLCYVGSNLSVSQKGIKMGNLSLNMILSNFLSPPSLISGFSFWICSKCNVLILQICQEISQIFLHICLNLPFLYVSD